MFCQHHEEEALWGQEPVPCALCGYDPASAEASPGPDDAHAVLMDALEPEADDPREAREPLAPTVW